MAAIRKRGDKWQARVRIKGQATIEKSFHSRADAEAWAKITESEIIRGVFIKRTDAERTTLAEALERYEREITPGKRGADVEQLRIKAWKADKLAHKSLAVLRSTDFAQWRDARLKKVSGGTVRKEVGIISHLFNIARKEWGYEGLTNPIEAIRLPSEGNARIRFSFMASSDHRNLLVHTSQWAINPRLGIAGGDEQIQRQLVTALASAL